MVHIVAIGRLATGLLEKKRGEDRGSFECDAFERGPLAIGNKKVAESLSEELATLSAWELEYILSPFRDCFIGTLDIFDEIRSIFRAPLEVW